MPRAALLCAAAATLSAACWSILTPPFQVPDEPDHFAYVKQLAETGKLPGGRLELSNEEGLALTALGTYELREVPQYRILATQSGGRRLQRALRVAESTPTRGRVNAGVAESQPPLFYALEAVPYSLGGTLLGRLELMRLLSALLAGLTAMFVFLFVREALPGAPWAWTVGGLGVALFPLLGFMSGSVNPDAGLFAVSAAVFYCLARGFRRGLAPASAVALGVAIALAFLTKLNFVGLAPGALLGFAILGVRAVRASGRAAYRSLALGIAIALAPPLAYVAIHVVSHRPTLGIVSAGVHATHGSLSKELSYIWELFLPRLPGMTDYFHGLFPPRQIWFDGFVGLYGWVDTPFPGWVESLALIPALLVLALCARSLLDARAALGARLSELLVYVVMCVGLLGLIGADSFHAFPLYDAEYGQARYLLPLLPLFGAVLVLAARGAGRRLGPPVGVLIVLLFFAHDLFSQLQLVARFYG
jgi:4-amino-4-deoxy-L-arabinose transferase-like glycosyltransferase